MLEYQKKLAGLLREASVAVEGHEAMASDLATIAHAVDVMPLEKFSTCLNAEAIKKMFDGAKPVVEGTTPAPMHNPAVEVLSNKSSWDKNAFTWNEKAAALVREKLASTVRKSHLIETATLPDAVKGAGLPSEQVPDGSHSEGTDTKGIEEATKASLTKEQTPDQEKALDTHMVEESEAPVVKPAGVYKFAGVEMEGSTIDGIFHEASDELNTLFR